MRALKPPPFGVLVGALAFAAGGATACSSGASAQAIPALTSVTYHQDRSIPNFDSSPHTVNDPPRLEALRSVLQKNGWHRTATTNDPGSHRGCTGGTSTDLQITFADGQNSSFHVYDCDDDNRPLTRDVTALVDSWHESDG